MVFDLHRRKFVMGSVAVVVGSIAGCTGGGNGGEEDGGDEAGDGDGTDNGNGETDGNGDDGTADEEGDEGEGEEVIFRDAVQMGESFAFESEFETEEAQGTATGRYYEDDIYYHVETQEQTVEVYEIDDETYVVFVDEDMCVKNPGEEMKPDSGGEGEANPDEYEADVNDYPEITPKGTTTIDGETVYIFEITDEDTEMTVTYYVSVETGYIRRVETQDGVVDLHSWDDVDPVQPPDMDCRDISDMPSPGDF